MVHGIEIRMAPCNRELSQQEAEQMTNIVNRVYAAAERDLWKEGTIRTTEEEVIALVHKGEMAIAYSKGQIVGCIRIRRMDEEKGELGMLAVDDTYQGSGIGRKLIQFAEQKCLKEKFGTVQLELLVPKEGKHPAKEILENWYIRLGYHPVKTIKTEALLPAWAQPRLALPCKFIVFHKELTGHGE